MAAAVNNHGNRKRKRGRRRACALVFHCFALALLCAASGCLHTTQERFQEFHDDGVYLYSLADFAGARESFAMALELEPENAGLLYNIGQCYDRQGDWQRAEKTYITCLEKEPGHAECRFALIQLMYETDRRPEASRLIDEWLSVNPEIAMPYVADSWRLRQEGDIIDALARVQQGLAKEPRNLRGLVEMGIIYERLERPSRALILYERALEESPKQADLVSRVNYLRSKNVGKPLPN